jgi:hypothetical protein
MKAVDFFSQPRSLQERILGGIEGRFPPSPLLAQHEPVRVKTAWFGLSAASLVLLVVSLLVGYGSLGSSFSREPVWMLLVLALSVFGMVFGVVLALSGPAKQRLLPYKPGVYVYQASVLDLRSLPGRTFDCTDFTAIQPGSVLGLSTTTGETINVSGTAEAIAQAASELGRSQTVRAEERLDLDPLHEPKFANPLGELEPLKRQVPSWVRVGWAIAAGIGLVAAPPMWFLRNRASDTSTFHDAKAKGNAAAYESYLTYGKTHREEVERLLLPRAKLKEVVAKQDTDALLAFAETYERSSISDDVRAATRDAYARELAKAKTSGNLADLRAFQTKYPKHGLTLDYAEAVHQVFVAAQNRFAPAKVGEKASDPQAVLRRIIGRAEASGPAFEVRVRRKVLPPMSRIDKAVSQLAEYMGDTSRPSRYFDEPHLASHESKVSALFDKLFREKFTPEFLDAKLGAPLPESAPLAAKVPTLFITVGVDWSGRTTPSKKPRGVYIGLLMHYEIELHIPEERTPYKTQLTVTKQVSSALLKELEDAPRTPPIEEKIYETMLAESRTQLETKLGVLLFGK